MIQARIRKRFPQARESRSFMLDVDLKASAGVTVLFGPSGAGKTLTLDAIAGFIRPDEGRILLDDDILFDGATKVNLPPQQRKCGYVFQNYALFPHMTLRQNLEFAADRFRRLERHRRVNDMLQRFRLQDVAGRRPHELSGGQKQRCSIARALVGTPRLLLLDEPARGLDLPLRLELYEVLRQVRADFETPILLVTHDVEECFAIGDDMVILSGGKVIQHGPPKQILAKPASLDVARLLGAVNVLKGEIRALDPQANSSRVRVEGAELTGRYLPGHLLGDNVLVYARADGLLARPAVAAPGANEIAVTLVRWMELPGSMRLEFEKELTVDLPVTFMSPQEWENARRQKKWVVEFPTDTVRVL